MPQATLTPSAPLIQGVASPNVVVDKAAFYAATRRLKFPMKSSTNIAGLGSTDSVQLRQTGIVAVLEVRVKGTLTFGGTITGTSMSYEWPFNLVKEFRLSANGQSNLVKARGLSIRALELATNPRITDQGITKSFNGANSAFGTLALSSDDWGTFSTNALTPNGSVAATGAYTVDLSYFIPVAADMVSLVGSVYAQSAATNLALDIDWNTQNALLTLGGSATVAQALTYQVTGHVYSIPNVGGQYVVPDLSAFHQLAEFRQSGLGQNDNQVLLPGTGVGRKLMRVLHNVYSSGAPLALTAANFSTLAWAYGGSDTPESYPSGQDQRVNNLRQTGSDLGALWGFSLWDFASQFALRDVVDEGATSDLRIIIGLVSAPTNGAAQVLQETIFAAPVGA
ncbi:MAG TPA: hypothetical protein VHA75_01045 [Rugosimonospora sp.]|nr:hypothetical protein [Rugosimonospora sp.]